MATDHRVPPASAPAATPGYDQSADSSAVTPEPRPAKPHMPWTPGRDPLHRCDLCGATDTSLMLTPDGKKTCFLRCGRGAPTGEEAETPLDIPGATKLTVADWQELLTDAAKMLEEHLDIEPGHFLVTSQDIRAFAAHLPALTAQATALAALGDVQRAMHTYRRAWEDSKGELAALRARVEAPEILGLIEGSMAAHKVLDQFGAPRETGDTLADRITMLRDSYEHRLAALAPRQPTGDQA